MATRHGAFAQYAQFSPLLSLKALAYFDDLALTGLPTAVRQDLVGAVTATDPRHLPILPAIRRRVEGS
jgi:hypothetical protein